MLWQLDLRREHRFREGVCLYMRFQDCVARPPCSALSLHGPDAAAAPAPETCRQSCVEAAALEGPDAAPRSAPAPGESHITEALKRLGAAAHPASLRPGNSHVRCCSCTVPMLPRASTWTRAPVILLMHCTVQVLAHKRRHMVPGNSQITDALHRPGAGPRQHLLWATAILLMHCTVRTAAPRQHLPRASGILRMQGHRPGAAPRASTWPRRANTSQRC